MNTDSAVIQIRAGFVNAFIIRGRRSILMDAGDPGREKKILKELETLKIKPKDISLILITHGHLDHFGSVDSLRQITGAPVAVHRRDVEALKSGRMKLTPRTRLGKLFVHFDRGVKSVAEAIAAGPDILVDGEMSLDEFGAEGTILETPGHTGGSVSVYVSSGEVIVGDLLMSFFKRSKPGWPMFADDMDQVRSSIRSILDLRPKVIFAGHGGPFSPESVRRLISK